MATELNALNSVTDFVVDNPIPKVGIVISEWNQSVTSSLLAACKEQLLHSGLKDDDIYLLEVPGSFELPFGVKKIQSIHSSLDAVIAIGSVIKGDTKHDDYLNRTVTSALMQLSLIGSVPVILGLLTTEDEQQAIDRSGGSHGNKGYEWALSALKMAKLKRQDTKRKIGF